MDRLSRNAMLARQAGMSYGKWKAMQEPVKIEEKPLPEGWVKCQWCGKLIEQATKRKKLYCDTICGRQAYYQKNKAECIESVKRCRAKKAEGGI